MIHTGSTSGQVGCGGGCSRDGAGYKRQTLPAAIQRGLCSACRAVQTPCSRVPWQGRCVLTVQPHNLKKNKTDGAGAVCAVVQGRARANSGYQAVLLQSQWRQT